MPSRMTPVGRRPMRNSGRPESTPRTTAKRGVEKRTVSVPLHDRVRTGTLRGIAEDAGAKDFDEFCKWVNRKR
jgi:hypothetical protein